MIRRLHAWCLERLASTDDEILLKASTGRDSPMSDASGVGTILRNNRRRQTARELLRPRFTLKAPT